MKLHITNGDSTVGAMRAAGIKGEIHPWRDVLHDGPTPAGLKLEEMSKVRARFIADQGWGELETVLEDFRRRDAALASVGHFEEVILWFEHDLYDQLQLLQLLDWFSTHPPGSTRLSLICIDDYLGMISSERLASLPDERLEVTPDQLELGRVGWTAFCSPNPRMLEELVAGDPSSLPFLGAAIVRFLEEYPSTDNGLSRNERQIIQVVKSGVQSPGEVFQAALKLEDAIYLGDWPFWTYIRHLMTGARPLLEKEDGSPFRSPPSSEPDEAFMQQRLRITATGVQVLNGELDWVTLNPPNKWMGGVHLREGNMWRWDGTRRRLVNR